MKTIKSKTNWEELSKILRSKNNILILDSLCFSEFTPTKLAHKNKIHKSVVSKSLKTLLNTKTISCLTPNESKGKLYQITPKGKKIIEKIKEIEDGTN
jgi:predicted transcriptional regulator